MVIRFNDLYEVARFDRLNYAVFRVLPDGEERGGKVFRKSEDGRTIKHLGTYHGSLAAAVREAARLLIADGLDGSEATSVAELVERAESAISAEADRIQSLVEGR